MEKLFAEAAQQYRQLNEYLHTVTDFNAAFGTYSIRPDGDFDLPVTVKLVTGGAIKELTER